ncbi:peptidylprolyl isomerase [Flavobacterium selenitireducens]|uniref:peptidylprolyl isomerase n=1 Tax=Flavobacterium selenitireducens TaxID=2722704 RepID=UPI001CC3303C|nr:peptidylprolyl isomerase [Flavobacterium selenitireducens]
MKFISKLILVVGILMPMFAGAQDTTDVAQNTEPVFQKRQKVDGIIATIGDYLILDSDIDKAYLEIKSQGADISAITRCQLLGKLMEDKLYAHQAIQDSIVIQDSQVREKMNKQLDYMVEQLGTIDKVVSYFNKDNEEDFRSEMFEVLKTNMLVEQERDKIIDEVKITPEEVRTFFNKIPKEELPSFGAEMEVSQIVVEPKVSQAETDKVIRKLKEIKKEVQDGASFFGKAVLYTDDKGSSSTGGFYKINRKTQFVKEFKDVAFSLGEGEISEPFASEFGYHIIMVEKIRGQEVELRHILMVPKVSESDMREAKEKAALIKKRIDDGEISFADAARTMSDEKETRANGGILINPKTQDTRFELNKLDPAFGRDVTNLKNNEVSNPILETEPSGKKKYKLLTVTNRYEEHTADYAKDYTKIKALALKEKQLRAIGKWFDDKIKDTYIKINGEYSACEFTNDWLKKK